MGPLLAAGSPGVWALSVVRSFGSLVFSLGAFISGTDRDAAEFLQLISIPGASSTVPFPRLSATAGTDALNWWGARLNQLFGVVSDLAVFTDASGNYVAAKHLEAMLTVEQIFRRTTSMLVAHRDTHGRRALFFTLLDSLESITGIDILKMCNLSHAKATFDRVSRQLPQGAAEVLLPAAKRAVNALEDMQDGFFIRRQLGTVELEFHLGPAGLKVMSLEEGVARYLKVLRDATHGHGSNKAATAALTDALLAHHDGELPHDIGLLAYLYLLDVLCDPARLRRVLYRSGK
jgi:plasmid stability protein